MLSENDSFFKDADASHSSTSSGSASSIPSASWSQLEETASWIQASATQANGFLALSPPFLHHQDDAHLLMEAGQPGQAFLSTAEHEEACHAALLKSHVATIESLKALREHHVDKNTMVLWDLDNTIIHSHVMEARDEWFRAYLTHWNEQGDPEAFNRTITRYLDAHSRTTVEVIEPETRDVVEEMNQLAKHTFGITSRGHMMKEDTARQLESVNVSFNPPEVQNFQKDLDGRLVVFHNGVLFCNGRPKSHCLTAFLNETGIKAKSMFFVDDHEKHVRDLQEMAAALSIHYVGFRYAAKDSVVTSFSLSEADTHPEHPKTFAHATSKPR